MPAPSTNSGRGQFGQTLRSGDLGELILQVQDLRQRVLNLEERLGTRWRRRSQLGGVPASRRTRSAA